jgi:hypothetical protein
MNRTSEQHVDPLIDEHERGGEQRDPVPDGFGTEQVCGCQYFRSPLLDLFISMIINSRTWLLALFRFNDALSIKIIYHPSNRTAS